MLESEFRDRLVKPYLKKIKAYFFVKEALALLGIPDIIGCHNGKFFAMELKRSKNSHRRKMQAYVIGKIKQAGGFAEFVYPENWEQIKKDLSVHCGDK